VCDVRSHTYTRHTRTHAVHTHGRARTHLDTQTHSNILRGISDTLRDTDALRHGCTRYIHERVNACARCVFVCKGVSMRDRERSCVSVFVCGSPCVGCRVCRLAVCSCVSMDPNSTCVRVRPCRSVCPHVSVCAQGVHVRQVSSA
jgi:hypothetical protein